MIEAGDEFAGALFSDDERMRYKLWRCWDALKPRCNFLMLNPSTADHLKTDPTVTRARIFATDWGYGALDVTNIHALRSTDPEALYACSDPTGPDNNPMILEVASAAQRSGGIVICAWGQHGRLKDRGMQVFRMLRSYGIKMHYLRMGAHNQPWHPLYLPKDLKPTEWVI